MSEDPGFSPDERGEPRNIIERGMPDATLKSLKKLKQEQRTRANMLDLNGVESEHSAYRGELAKLLIILVVGVWLFRWLTGF